MKPILGGVVYCHSLDGWDICWESRGDYRHWCTQTRTGDTDHLIVVMKNPGSLSGDGANLRKDTTLRILRKVGEAVQCGWTIVNLFDFASPKLAELHEKWTIRDGGELVYPKLDIRRCRAVVFAYGDLHPDFELDYTQRISLARDAFASLPEIRIPITLAKNPVHPMNWQRNKLMKPVIEAIRSHFAAGRNVNPRLA